jgi:hypothetical protein
MSILPQSTILGNLEIIEVYVYCDQPCLFACRNRTGHIFLAVWIEETAVFNQWLYVALSEQRFTSIRSGKIDLRDAFLKSEEGFVFEVKITRDRSPDSIIIILCARLDEDWLPRAGEFLELAADTNPLISVTYV